MGGAPMGVYTTTIAATDVPDQVPDSIRAGLVGTWALDFRGGHTLVTIDGHPVVDAPYAMHGSGITLGANDTGERACKAAATYSMENGGGQLTFTRIADPCQGRVIVLTTHPLMRRP
jgi:hypothetical protein